MCLPNEDHNHETGERRKFLCNPCNRGIGYLQDSPDILRKAIMYLIEHNNSADVESEGSRQ